MKEFLDNLAYDLIFANSNAFEGGGQIQSLYTLNKRNTIVGEEMSMHDAGFEELEHTADLLLKVWAPDLTGLFVQAALGVNQLMLIRMAEEDSFEKEFKIAGADKETLLVMFLEEIIYLAEECAQGFYEFDLEVGEMELCGTLRGRRIQSLATEIKAVTFHGLAIKNTKQGLETQIVFDV